MQNEPLWPSPEALIQINADEVAATGEPHALLSPSLLESAWAKPINRWSCENVTDIVPLAVALMVGIAQNHPFQQGNKRTAFQAGVVFMEANNLRLPGRRTRSSSPTRSCGWSSMQSTKGRSSICCGRMSSPILEGKSPPPRSRQPSLAARLIALATVWSVAVLLIAGWALSSFFHRAALSRFDQGLADITDTLYAGSTVGEGGAVLAPAIPDARTLRTYSGRYWEVAEPQGAVFKPLQTSRSLFDAELPAAPGEVARVQATPGQPIFYNAVGPGGQRLRVAAVLAHLPGRSAPVIFMAGEDRSPIERDVQRFAATTAATLVALGVGLLIAVFIQVRVGLNPLFVMGREIAEVRRGRAQRLARGYPAELAPLAGELNALLDHNQEVVERQRTHVGNLAHALKTPISVLLAETERRPGEMAELVRRQADAMRGHVEHHLRRARAAARSQTAGERTLIAPVLDELCRTLERIHQRKGVAIDWRCPDGLAFRGERQDLLEIAGNVLENACKWCDEQVRAGASALDDGALLLVVEDDGPGLPAALRAEVIARGARLDESAPGSGLGLAIVDDLAKAYGGSLTLADAALGGLRVELRLPRAEG